MLSAFYKIVTGAFKGKAQKTGYIRYGWQGGGGEKQMADFSYVMATQTVADSGLTLASSAISCAFWQHAVRNIAESL